MKKTCRVCGFPKGKEWFYIRKDGRNATICKPCHRKRTMENHNKDKAHHLKMVKAWQQANKEKVRMHRQRYWKNNKEKYEAQRKLRAAVRYGFLSKPEKCQICSRKIKKVDLAGHHKDYSKPLEVVWMCDNCHKKTHSKDADNREPKP